MRGRAADFRKLDLRVHDLLNDVPLQDVWSVDLPGGKAGCTLRDVPGLLPQPEDRDVGWAVRSLFRLRQWLGRVFRWDKREPLSKSYASRLGEEDRRRSRTPPGAPGIGPFRVIYEFETESLAEVRNATVHAFLSTSLQTLPDGYRVWIGIFVKPVGRGTGAYMALIGPFRHWIIYPALLRRMRRRWLEP